MEVTFDKKSKIADLSDADIKVLADRMMKAFYDLLISNINSNPSGYFLKKSTLLGRKRKGTGTKPLVDSGSYRDSIKMKDGIVYVSDGSHTSGISFAELSEILEYGRYDKHFVGFPHWRPTVEQFKPMAQDILYNFIKEKLVK